jgi:hypothetical protein
MIPTAKTKPAPIARSINPPTTSAPTRAPEGGGGIKAASWKQKLQDKATLTAGQAGTPES